MHNFHIPVMGLSFSADSPLKVAQYGISSVVSLGNDTLLEDMRKHYSREHQLEFIPITEKEEDARSRRITAYLNMLNTVVQNQIKEVKAAPLDGESKLNKYLQMLPATSPLKSLYARYQKSDQASKTVLESLIRNAIAPGAIYVNIMTRLNKPNPQHSGKLSPGQYSDALAALRGYANSNLKSSVVFSAGFNPHLYTYLEQFPEFFPDEDGLIKKKVILKVSDYRSALVQGKFLAKKGIWVSEFRIESGLNCGGHAFPTEGLLLGPILEKFRDNRTFLKETLLKTCQPVWQKKGINVHSPLPLPRLTVQGGIGTAQEQNFLLEHYGVESTGWGSPFLLVPQATTVDTKTLSKLTAATTDDLYLSKSSPMGVPFNSLRTSASEEVRKERIAKGRPGSPCLKKHLVSNTEFTEAPVCTASRQYQNLKIKELKEKNLDQNTFDKEYENIVVKSCLCEDLSATAYLSYGAKAKIKPAPAICPGPNLAFFSRQYSLMEMVDHIYGRKSLLNESSRPHMFVNELKMYVSYLEGEWQVLHDNFNTKKTQYLKNFKTNLEKGISYYQDLSRTINSNSFGDQLDFLAQKVQLLKVPVKSN